MDEIKVLQLPVRMNSRTGNQLKFFIRDLYRKTIVSKLPKDKDDGIIHPHRLDETEDFIKFERQFDNFIREFASHCIAVNDGEMPSEQFTFPSLKEEVEPAMSVYKDSYLRRDETYVLTGDISLDFIPFDLEPRDIAEGFISDKLLLMAYVAITKTDIVLFKIPTMEIVGDIVDFVLKNSYTKLSKDYKPLDVLDVLINRQDLFDPTTIKFHTFDYVYSYAQSHQNQTNFLRRILTINNGDIAINKNKESNVYIISALNKLMNQFSYPVLKDYVGVIFDIDSFKEPKLMKRGYDDNHRQYRKLVKASKKNKKFLAYLFEKSNKHDNVYDNKN